MSHNIYPWPLSHPCMHTVSSHIQPCGHIYVPRLFFSSSFRLWPTFSAFLPSWAQLGFSRDSAFHTQIFLQCQCIFVTIIPDAYFQTLLFILTFGKRLFLKKQFWLIILMAHALAGISSSHALFFFYLFFFTLPLWLFYLEQRMILLLLPVISVFRI